MSLLPDLKHCVPFSSTFCTSTCCFVTSPAVSTALLCSRVLGSLPWLFLSLSSRPFGTCFNQPTIHPLGLKASVVHDHCKRRCCGHRISNLLKILDVKGSQYVTMCNSAFKHKLHLATRLAKLFVSSDLPNSPSQRLAKQPGSSPTFTLEHSCARAFPRSRICWTVFHSHSLNSSRDSKHQYQLLFQNRGNHDSDVTRFRNTHTGPS